MGWAVGPLTGLRKRISIATTNGRASVTNADNVGTGDIDKTTDERVSV